MAHLSWPCPLRPHLGSLVFPFGGPHKVHWSARLMFRFGSSELQVLGQIGQSVAELRSVKCAEPQAKFPPRRFQANVRPTFALSTLPNALYDPPNGLCENISP
ncbi:hypothetical protein CRENBAI_001649 [Crenichthys baileyi]|uniref:Uncharacterized protein n=1 Tax=Crenichthys baileyi TaxID=28760 RepID=A0AAV9SMF7_9TELE